MLDYQVAYEEVKRQADRRRDEIERLREENAQLRARITKLEGKDDVLLLKTIFDLTAAQAHVLAYLVRNGRGWRNDLVEACYKAHDQVTMDSPDFALSHLIVRIRRKLRPRGIAIKTLYGIGYELPEQDRRKLKQLIREKHHESHRGT